MTSIFEVEIGSHRLFRRHKDKIASEFINQELSNAKLDTKPILWISLFGI